MRKLRCRSCNFVFTKSKDKMPGRCPYCGEQNAVITEDSYFNVNRELEQA